MALQVRLGPVADLQGYIEVPATVEALSALGVPFRKDYDLLESPLRWPLLFDVSNWVLASAWLDGRQVAGAIGARDTPGVDMLEGKRNLLAVWDLRVATDARGTGIGTALFHALESWGREQGCTELKVETQDVNVAACAFYLSQGCTLAQSNPHAYPELPDEVQLIWWKRIA